MFSFLKTRKKDWISFEKFKTIKTISKIHPPFEHNNLFQDHEWTS